MRCLALWRRLLACDQNKTTMRSGIHEHYHHEWKTKILHEICGQAILLFPFFVLMVIRNFR